MVAYIGWALGNQSEMCEKVGKELQSEEELTRQRCVEMRRGEAGRGRNEKQQLHVMVEKTAMILR